MKKQYLLAGLMVAALCFTACDEDYTDWAEPQSNPQEEIVTLPSSFSASAASASDLALAGDSVTVFTYSQPSLSEGGTIKNFRLDVTPADVENAETVRLEADVQGRVATAELQALIEQTYGKRPVERTLNAKVYASIVQNEQAFLATCDPIVLKITPIAPQISEHYYVIGAPSTWDPTETSLQFNHSDADVYEDPIFTITFPVSDLYNPSDPSIWFAVTDDITVEMNDWSYVFGCCEGNGLNGMEGTLARRSELADDGSWKVTLEPDTKFVKMTLDMMEGTYTLSLLSFGEYIYVPGNPAWSPATAAALRSPNFDGVYTGFAYLDGDFKFTKARDWNSEYNSGDFPTMGEGLGQGDGSNINCSAAGYYKMIADVPNGSLTITEITSWSIIGAVTGDSSWGTDIDLTWNAADESWEVTTDLVAGEFKFRANHDWGTNLGTSFDNLEQDGGNLSIAEDGTYEVKLFTTRNASDNLYCTVTKK